VTLLLGLVLQAAEERIRTEVRVRIHDSVEEERAVREYRQARPVDVRRADGRFSTRVWFESGCEAVPPRREGGFSPLEGKPGNPPVLRREDPWNPPPPWKPWTPWDPDDPPPVLPRDIPVQVGGGGTIFSKLTLTGRVSLLRFDAADAGRLVGETRADPAAVAPAAPAPPPPAPPSGGGGPPPPPPTATRYAVTTNGSSVTVDGSEDGGLSMAGPELALPVLEDPAGWLPRGTALTVSARAQVGSIEAGDGREDARLVAAGPGLRIPLLRFGAFLAEASVFAGAGWLDTDAGEAWGFSGGAGLSARLGVGAGVALAVAAEAEFFEGDGVSAWGPAFTMGLNFGW
jgi:hypothetical protein